MRSVSCNPASRPQVQYLNPAGQREDGIPAERVLDETLNPADDSEVQEDVIAAERVLDDTLWTIPPSPVKDFRELFSDLKSHHECFFMELLDRQKELQDHLSVMQSTLREAADAQSASKEDMQTEFNEFSCRYPSAEASQSIMKTHLHLTPPGSKITALTQSGTGKLVGEDSHGTSPSIINTHQHVTHRGQEIAAFDQYVTGKLMGEDSNISADEFHEQASNPVSDDAQIAIEPVLPKLETSKTLSFQQSDDDLMSRSKSRNSFNFSSQVISEGNGSGNRRAQLARLLQKKECELAVASAILGNAFIMCWESQYVGLDIGFNLQYPGRQKLARIVWPGADTAFQIFDMTFGVVFFIEMVVKILCFGSKYFYRSSNKNLTGRDPRSKCRKIFDGLQGWNLLDLICVLAFLLDKMMGGSGSVNPQMLRLLRLFRLFRLVRLLRFLEMLDHLYVMTTAIAGLSRVLTWAIILLSTMLLTCNLFLVQILQATYFGQVTVSDLDEEQLKMHRQMYAYFGTCTRCMLSMFEITLGNWPPVARLLSEEVSEWFTLVCLVHKLTIGFAVIGVINAIILQETFKVADSDDIIMFRQKKRASNTLRKKMERLFYALDNSGDGALDIDEFVAIGEDPEMKIWLSSLDIEADSLRTLFDLLDMNSDGYVTLDELVTRVPRVKGAARSMDMLSMKKSFELHSGIQRQSS